MKVFPVPGIFGGLWYTTWQLCCGNNSNDLGIDLDYDYDYDYEMLLLRHKEIQYYMS